jgi:hypothetical protein
LVGSSPEAGVVAVVAVGTVEVVVDVVAVGTVDGAVVGP